jgi:hypothetical protein
MNRVKRSLVVLIAGAAILSIAASALAYQPTRILGPGLNSGQTIFHQSWNETLSADTLYILTGHYYVDSTFALTIPAGTTVRGDTASVLVVQRGAQIFANGEADNPVVFTSNQPPGMRSNGDWGGVILLGQGPCNKINALIEGGIILGTYGPVVAGADTVYYENDNSGVFKYCRIEFPGYRLQEGNEVNGLTMGAIGNGTEIHHVQVSFSDDDSYEWFGGNVNAHHLVAIGGKDDIFDTDFGFAGSLQYVFSMRDPAVYETGSGHSNGHESNNDDTGTTDTPYTDVTVSNGTIVGPASYDAIAHPDSFDVGNKFRYAGYLRKLTKIDIFNSVFVGHKYGIAIGDAGTAANALADELKFRNNSVASWSSPTGGVCVHDESKWAGVCTWFNTAGWGNIGDTVRMPSAVGLGDLSDPANPNPVPQPGSECIGSADWSAPEISGWADQPTYRGAFDPDLPMSQQWTAGWTDFDPKNTQYLSVEDNDFEVAISRDVLLMNYPDPFNPVTTIKYSVPTAGRITLKVYNVQGQEVATLVNGNATAGVHEAVFTTDVLPTGTYFCRLAGNGFEATEKMVLLK